MSLTVPLDRPGKQFGHIRIPHSADDSAWGHVMIPICIIAGGDGPTALITGGNHGDEYEGPLAIRQIIQDISPEAVTGRLILIPSLNHPAVQAARRTSPIDGVNLNRAFPGDTGGTVTRKIAAFYNDHLIPEADLIADIHSGGKTLDFLPMAVSHILDDAEQDARCARAARTFSAPYTARLREIDDTGMLDGAVERAGKTFVTTEIGGGGTTTPDLIKIAYDGLRRCLAAAGICAADLPPAPSRALDLSDPGGFHFATHAGMLRPHVALGEAVARHQILAEIYPLDDLEAAPKILRAQKAGLLAARHVPGLIKPGDCAFVIGTDGGPIDPP